MADEDELKPKRERKHNDTRTLGTEQVVKEAKADKKAAKVKVPEVVVNPDAHLPAVFEADLHEVAIKLPEPEPFLEIPDGLSFAEWVAAKEQFKPLTTHLSAGQEVIQRYDDSLMWRVGDFMNYGRKMNEAGVEGYKDQYEQYLDGSDYGYSHDTLRKAMWVSKQIPPRERFATISFKHHEAVAKMEPADRKRLLTRAQKEGWSVSELRIQKNGGSKPGTKTTKEPAKTVEPMEFTAREIQKGCEVIYDLYEYAADIAQARKKDADAEIDFAELDKRARAAAHVVTAILIGIGEALKESEAA